MTHSFPKRRSSDLEAAKERARLRIHRFALRQVDPDRASLAVAEKPPQFVCRANRGVEPPGLVLDQARGLAAHSGAREIIVGGRLEQRAARHAFFGRGADGDLVTIPPVPQIPCNAFDPKMTSTRSTKKPSMVKPSRLPSRSGVDWGMPLIA